MLSTNTIRHLADKAAKSAAQNNLIPYVPYDLEEVSKYPTRDNHTNRSYPFPNLGSHIPDGWTLIDWWTVVKSPRDTGPALSWDSLNKIIADNLHNHFGYALIEEGPFQVVIGQFSK